MTLSKLSELYLLQTITIDIYLVIHLISSELYLHQTITINIYLVIRLIYVYIFVKKYIKYPQ